MYETMPTSCVQFQGLAQRSAARFLAEVGVANFQQATQVAAYAGLIPAHATSGTSVRKRPTLSKIGNRHLRSAFYMPALTAQRHNPIVQALVERLTARGKHKMVIVGAVMRSLFILLLVSSKPANPLTPIILNNNWGLTNNTQSLHHVERDSPCCP